MSTRNIFKMQKICKGASLPDNFQTGADACLRGAKTLSAEDKDCVMQPI